MRLSNIFSLHPLWWGIVIIFWDANFLQKLPRRISCCRIKGVVWMGIIYLPLVKCYCIVFKHVFILLQYCLSCVTKLFIDMVVVWVLKLVGIGRGNPFIQELFPMQFQSLAIQTQDQDTRFVFFFVSIIFLVSKNNIKSWNILFLLLVRDLVKWALMLKKGKKKTDP